MTDTDNSRPAPTAVSLDGRYFEFAGSLRSALEPGRFVTLLSDDGTRQLGQIEDAGFSIGGDMHGSGRILGIVAENGQDLDRSRSVPFSSALLTSAEISAVSALASPS